MNVTKEGAHAALAACAEALQGDTPHGRLLWLAMQEVLRTEARRPCFKRNCGSVCRCSPCHARYALAQLDPEWRAR